MGLAGTKVKQRFGLDPRNTSWSNNTERFGHQYLEKMGWAPGKGLGLVDHASTSHVKVSIKTDNAGLGSKLGKKTKTDEFDSGECAGLDVFQRILGRLNGKEQQVNSELERKRHDNIVNGKWGIHFVKGETLGSTWDSEKKELTKKRMFEEEEEERVKKRSKKSKEKDEKKKEKKEKKDKKDKKDKTDKKEKKDKKDKDKTEKQSKKSKKDKKDKDKTEKQSKKSKKDKKQKKSKSKKSFEKEEVTRESMLQPREAKDHIATRLSVRAKWIRQKRASVMDVKALNEIFMITKS